MEHNYKIYMHKNKINGKVYIGQTSKSLDERCGKNGSGYIGCIRFYNAIQKYGWNNFEHEIIEDNILDGGFGEKVASYLGDKDIKVLNYGQKRVYTDQVPLKEILKDNRMTVDQIVEDIENA